MPKSEKGLKTIVFYSTQVCINVLSASELQIDVCLLFDVVRVLSSECGVEYQGYPSSPAAQPASGNQFCINQYNNCVSS